MNTKTPPTEQADQEGRELSTEEIGEGSDGEVDGDDGSDDDDDIDLAGDDSEEDVIVDVAKTSSKRKRSAEDYNEEEISGTKVKKSREHDLEMEGDASDDDEEVSGNAGWADAMAKIIASDKAVLSKAKKDKDVVIEKKKTIELEVIDAEGKTKTLSAEKPDQDDPKSTQRVMKTSTAKETNYGRTKPHLLEKQFERSLQRIATRGVIQLFNAVNQHQKDVKDKIRRQGKSEFKRDAVVKSVTKGDFIDLLKAGTTKTTSDRVSTTKSAPAVNAKLPVSESTWKILRDDFMMSKGKTMKDWDKESDSGED